MPSCLVVDDSRIIRRVAKRILEALSFETDEAADGQEALTQCTTNVPDVVLLDWNMPNMDGMEFLRQLRGKSIRQPMVIFCTGRNGTGDIRQALDAGADDYIMKPFDREILESKFIQAGLC